MNGKSNVSNEQDLVDDFIVNYCQKASIKIKIFNSNVKSKKNCDLSFTMKSPVSNKKTYYCLEVKSFLSTNKYNNVLLFFGDILKNRRYQNIKSANVAYGVFFEFDHEDESNSFFVKRICDSFSDSDWTKFGVLYNCELMFFYDRIFHKLYYSCWTDFISKKALTEIP